jgi:pyruvate-formate lyase-activating enzyme
LFRAVRRKDKELENKTTEYELRIASLNKDIPWHISRFFPRYKMANWKKGITPVETLEKAKKIPSIQILSEEEFIKMLSS